MDNNSYEQLIITQAKIESKKPEMNTNKKYSDEKNMNLTEDFKAIIESTITSMMDQINIEGFTKASGPYHCGIG